MADPDRHGKRSRTGLLVAATLLVASAAALWAASRLGWVRLQTFDGLGEPRTVTVSGASWSAALVPMAVSLIAAAVATLAVRGWPLRALAVLVALIGATAAYLGVGIWAVRDVGPRAASVASVAVHTLVGADRLHGGAALALIAALLAVAAAVTLMRAARGEAASKYRTPAARRADAADRPPAGRSERVMWDSLDEGRDPTVGPT